jgi:drug/metabolite transporter (DMT)-like permease
MAFYQNLFGAFFILPWFWRGGLKSLKTNAPLLQSFRVISAAIGVLLWYWALAQMPIAQAVALSFTGPIFTVLGARLALHEPLSVLRLLAILFSFIGAFLILRPDLALSHSTALIHSWPILLPLASAIAIAASKLLTRKLGSQGESPYTMTLYLLTLMIPVTLVPALAEWAVPQGNQWLWLILLGALAGGAHFSTSQAYALADVTFLTPFGFARIFLSALIGYLAFAEFPHHWTAWGGTAIIVISVLIISYTPSQPSLKHA